jgi:hypothetical protein
VAYPCNVEFVPRSTYLGDYGYFHVTYYTQPHCSGTFVDVIYYCSEGATYNSCPASEYYLFDDTQQISIVYLAVASSARDGDAVNFTEVTCRSGSAGCGGPIGIR